MSLTLESMGVQKQVVELNRLAHTLRDLVQQHGGSMDRDEALDMGARAAEIPISQMRYVLTFALSTDLIEQDRVESTLTI